jgi:hypothetical protein
VAIVLSLTSMKRTQLDRDTVGIEDVEDAAGAP